ncbi:hypothetical protein V8E55_008351, partial [Tylopilus felleus]
FEGALDNLRKIHVTRLTSYKRLLEPAQVSSAAQTHALQAELSSRDKRTPVDGGEICVRGGRKAKEYWSEYAEYVNEDEEGVGLASASCGDGRAGFDEKEVKNRAILFNDKLDQP